MSSPLLTFLKYIFLAALYLFFLRVLRAVWIEMRDPKVTTVDPTTVRAAVAASPPTVERASPGPEVLVEHGPDGSPGRRFALAQETSVGRSPGCGVTLPDDSFVSQVHARVFRRDGHVWVEDLGSTNGTFVNDARVDAPTALRPGDRVRVGQTVLELSP
ncbi:MAG: FHA domain-containing protein [Acidimicrobiales bacterium]